MGSNPIVSTHLFRRSCPGQQHPPGPGLRSHRIGLSGPCHTRATLAFMLESAEIVDTDGAGDKVEVVAAD